MMTQECPFCEGRLWFLGVLGNLIWYRCEACGDEVSETEYEHRERIEQEGLDAGEIE